MRKRHFNQAQKAMFSVRRKDKTLEIPIKILTVWCRLSCYMALKSGALRKTRSLRNCTWKFCRILLSVKSSTSKCKIYGELGRFSLAPVCGPDVVKLLGKNCKCWVGKLNKLLYQVVSYFHNKSEIYTPRLARVKKLLNSCQLYHCWPRNVEAIFKTVSY